MIDELIGPFELAYMQRALVEILLLSALGGILGSWIVLRGLAFYTHAVGTATFPGLVVAGPWGIPSLAAALATALLAAFGLERLSRARRVEHDAATALVLMGALALGIILASDVYETGAGVDRLLFGTVLGLTPTDVAVAATGLVVVLAADSVLRRSWLATGFDPGAARSLGVSSTTADWLLLTALAVSVVVALDAVGALLVAAVFVLPAATVRLVARSVSGLRAGAVALGAAQGVAGLWLADRADLPPGPAIAVLGGAVFALVALARWPRMWVAS